MKKKKLNQNNPLFYIPVRRANGTGSRNPRKVLTRKNCLYALPDKVLFFIFLDFFLLSTEVYYDLTNYTSINVGWNHESTYLILFMI